MMIRAGVLIGGASRRMGTAKQLLELDGTTFLERVVAALAAHAGVTLLGEGPVPPACARLPRIADVPGVRGPLAGVLAALRAGGDGAPWVIAACDQPLLTPDAVAWLVGARPDGAWAVLPEIDGRAQPFPGLYDPRCADFLERAAAGAGPAGPTALAGDPRTASPRPPAALARAWRNANTPEEAAALRGDPPRAG
jgi:molybdopterin-guanine dinucleotide biosynthesis protein A